MALSPYALNKFGVWGGTSRKKAPSFAAVWWVDPFSAAVRLFSDSTLPSPRYSTGASIFSSEKWRSACAKATLVSWVKVLNVPLNLLKDAIASSKGLILAAGTQGSGL